VNADASRHVEHPPVDAVFSSDTIIRSFPPLSGAPTPSALDQESLFSSIAASLRPGGLLVSQWGGGANLSHLRERVATLREDPAFALYFRDFVGPSPTPTAQFAMPDEARERLERIGFVDVRAWLEAAPVRLPDAATYAAFVSSVVLSEELARLPDGARKAFVTRLVELSRAVDPPFELDYWRLNLDATRA
jgi:trans-aconitate 2-methyltransferase